MTIFALSHLGAYMRRELPPLTALIAFEAAARHMNFTRAAEELNVTQPAVSHQIQMLETDLGVRLFVRSGRQVILTTTGQEFFRSVTDSLGRIADVTKSVRKATDLGTVTIATNPGVAAFWLTPRLSLFQDEHPDLKVRVLTSERDRNLPIEDLDVAIRFGLGTWENTTAEMLMPEVVAPVFAPGYGDIDRDWTPELIWSDPALLHQEDDESRWFTWEDWRVRWCPDKPTSEPRVTFSNYSVAILQAISGKGIALGWTQMLADLLESDTLRLVSDFELTSHRGYFVVVPRGKPVREEVRTLCDWLIRESTS